eukprot:4271614-Amphidinium_carterae.3
MVKHAGFTYNRFQPCQDGQTPYSRTWGQMYKSAIIAFGETLLCQHSMSHRCMTIRRFQSDLNLSGHMESG